MINKKTRMITLLVIIINVAVVAGYVLAKRPTQDQITPYIDPGTTPKGHDWARDQALAFLELESGEWIVTDVTPANLLGTSVFLYESGSLSVTVSHCLNPTADYFVDVDYLGQSWSLRVSQNGECVIIQ
jgi:hypothetical protein